MGTGYTRNDTANNIADGNVINAADFDGEYDAIEAAFNSSTGHTHDGTSAEGAPITVLGPSQEFVASSSEVKPSTNAGLDLGTSSLKFKDLYIDGVAYIDGFGGDILAATDKKIQFRDTAIFINSSADGQLDIDADTTIELNSPEVIATDDFRLKSDAAILTFGADNDVTVTHVADTGLDAKAASGFALKLQTGDTTVESGNTLGKISFNAPDEASGTDSILVGAEIEAAAEATFSSTVNSTALVFKTNDSAAATERVRIKSDGDVVFTGASANMTWDTSADSLDFADGAQAAFGSDDDLVITHSGTAGSITNATGDLTVDVAGDIILDADGADVIFKDDGTQIGKITNASNNLEIHSSVSDADIVFKGNDGGVTVTALTLDMSEGGKAIFASGAETAFTGATTITTSDNTTQLTLESTDTDASPGPRLDFFRNSSSPADNDYIGRMRFMGKNSAAEDIVGVDFLGRLIDVTDGTEDATLFIQTMVGGTQYNRLNITPTEIVLNEESRDLDFRVEGNTNSAALFVHGEYDGVGIHSTSPLSYANAQAVLYIEDDANPAIAIRDTGQAKPWYIGALGTGLHFRYADGSNTGSASNVTQALELSNGGDGAIFNEGGANRDFRVESDGNANMLFVDANEDSVSVGTSSTSVSGLNVFSSGANTAAIAARGNGAANGMVLLGDLYTDDENQVTLGVGYANANGVLARGCKPHNSQTNAFLSSQDTYNVRPAALVVRDGGITVYSTTSLATTTTNSAVTLYNYLDMNTDETILNESSLNRDFRVESDASAYGFFMDAGTGYLAARGASQVRFTLGSTGTSGANTANWIRGNGSDIGLNAASGNIHFEIGGTEFVRIASGGTLNIGTTAASGASGNTGVGMTNIGRTISNCDTDWNYEIYGAQTGRLRLFSSAGGGTQVGSITVSTSATSYNTSSDYRLKENVVELTSATERLKQLQPKRFNFIAEAETTVDGFLAHEVSSIVPEAITGEKDAVHDDGTINPQSIDQSKLVPLLVATIKELEARITALENA